MQSLAPRSLVDVLRAHADARPEAPAFGFLDDGETVGRRLTFAELDEQARIVGATLQQLTSPGDRALLLYPPGLDFVVAFLGCQYAGVVAVPALPPNMSRVSATVDRVAGLIAAATPAIILTTAELLPSLRGATLATLGELRWQATNRLSPTRAAVWRPPALESDDLSFLQFTSGSTSTPKGVMVSHHNLLSNLEMLRETAAQPRPYNIVGWLPLFHDMGLIGVMLHGLHLGTETRLMSPLSFLKRPMRWLRAIAEHGDAVFSGGPNFAFDAVLRRVTAADKRGLDLSNWKVAFCGAETVRAGTMARFLAEFAECGLSREALLPCYGLAEATLVVSARTPGRPYEVRELDKAALEQGRAIVATAGADSIEVVSCGSPRLDQEFVIVDPQTLAACPVGTVGEIWVRGPNVARGYWADFEGTAETFAATTAAGDGPFLRTGDLGFAIAGELHVTGRIKEIIIAKGRCLYPQDLELMIDSLIDEFPELVPGQSVAFALPGATQERIGLIVKIARRRNEAHDPEALIAALQARTLEQFEVGLAEIALIKSSIPKTSSGKKMRSACAKMMARGLGDELGVEHHFRRRGRPGPAVDAAPVAAEQPARLGEAELARLIVEWLAREEQLDPATISTTQPLADLGLDSFVTVSLIDYLEQQLGTALSSSVLAEHRNIDELSRHLANPSAPRIPGARWSRGRRSPDSAHPSRPSSSDPRPR